MKYKAWRGAKADGWFSHIALAITGDDSKNERLEAICDEECKKL